jgi:hypothetical protein
LNESFNYSSNGVYEGNNCPAWNPPGLFLSNHDQYIVPCVDASVYYSISGRVIFPVHLQEITFNNGTISFIKSKKERLSYLHNKDFVKSTNKDPFYRAVKYHDNNLDCPQPIPELFMKDFINKAYQLDKIEMRNNQGFRKDFLFSYNLSNTERLRLKSLKEEGKPAYEFSYLGYDLNAPAKLPAYLTHQTDWNGYYTGAHDPLFLAFMQWDQRYRFVLTYSETRDELGEKLNMGGRQL